MNEFHSWTQKSPPVIGVAAHDQMFYFASRLSETKINYGHINNIFYKGLIQCSNLCHGQVIVQAGDWWDMSDDIPCCKILFLPLDINFWLVFNKQVNTLREAHIMF